MKRCAESGNEHPSKKAKNGTPASGDSYSPADVLSFFQNTPMPSVLPQVETDAKDFVQHHVSRGNRVVLVTSGGTTVPLEKNTVRFLDNFSSGSRGASSTESFIAAGYAVIFCHREGSLRPYARHFDGLDLCSVVHETEEGSLQLNVDDPLKAKLREVISKSRDARANNMLLEVPFTTVTEYLFLLRTLATSLRDCATSAMVYLAAAVSDFFIPESSMSEHKIQSREGALELRLECVPKLLGCVHAQWAPHAFFVSFKLETDEGLLVKKARASIEKYGVHVVVANMLQSYKKSARLVAKDDETPIHVDKAELMADVLVAQLKERHTQYIARTQKD